jgi:hypothetical protein
MCVLAAFSLLNHPHLVLKAKLLNTTHLWLCQPESHEDHEIQGIINTTSSKVAALHDGLDLPCSASA